MTDLAVPTLSVAPARIVSSRRGYPQGGCHTHPCLTPLPGNRILLTWQYDRDICDPRLLEEPAGLLSCDEGDSWKRVRINHPLPAPREYLPWYWLKGETVLSWLGGFQSPGRQGVFRIPHWRSENGGESWSELQWIDVEFPGVKGTDPYQHGGGHFIRANPPDYIVPYMERVSRLRGGRIRPMFTDEQGTLYSFAVVVLDGDADYPAVMLHVSEDNGEHWSFRSIVAYDKDRAIPDTQPKNCFTEPLAVMWPDGETLCVMRTGSHKRLYATRSYDSGVTWKTPQPLTIHGILPRMQLMSQGILVLATGRPGCTLHLSADRGRTWIRQISLFENRDPNNPKWTNAHCSNYPAHHDPALAGFNSSSCNNDFCVTVSGRLLYVHDVQAPLPDSDDPWIKDKGNGSIVLRVITVLP